MDFLNEFIFNLYLNLCKTDGRHTNIIRKHSKKLEESGDISFPLNVANWKSLPSADLQILNELHKPAKLDEIIKESTLWTIQMARYSIAKDNVFIYLDRSSSYRLLNDILENKSYGSFNLNDISFIVKSNVNKKVISDISTLRIKHIKDVTENLIRYCNGNLNGAATEDTIEIVFTSKSHVKNASLCGAVLDVDGSKNKTTTSDEYKRSHVTNMRLVAEHKYGVRVTSREVWREFFEKLGYSSMVLELLQNKPGSTLTVNLTNPLANNKCPSFILYNCARLSALFRQFDKRVSSGVYPDFPTVDKIDFSLLKEPEEWELYYVYILQFPNVVKNCLRDIKQRKVYPNCLVQHLLGLCSTFSIYYRRIKILMAPKEHLLSGIYAKIYLLKGLEKVLHIGLNLLNIQPVKQM